MHFIKSTLPLALAVCLAISCHTTQVPPLDVQLTIVPSTWDLAYGDGYRIKVSHDTLTASASNIWSNGGSAPIVEQSIVLSEEQVDSIGELLLHLAPDTLEKGPRSICVDCWQFELEVSGRKVARFNSLDVKAGAADGDFGPVGQLTGYLWSLSPIAKELGRGAGAAPSSERGEAAGPWW